MILGVVISALCVIAVANVYAQTDVSILDNSVLTEFTNIYDTDIDRIAVWFTTDHNIQSYVAEPGWRVVSDEQTLQMINGMLEPNQSVKVGLKFQGEGAQLAWLMASGDDILEQGWIIRHEVLDETPQETSEGASTSSDGILSESTFYTIPSKPIVGATIRVVGVDFVPNHNLELVIQDIKMGSFMTDSSGGFVTTLTLPENLKDRIEFVITDEIGNESIPLSLRLEAAPDTSIDTTLAITSIKDTHHIGDFVDISGTGPTGTTIKATLINPQGEAVSSVPVSISSDGLWSLSDSMVIPLSSDFGEYTIEITDGSSIISRTWTVESDTHILVKAVRSVFEPGQTLRFEGEVAPNIDVSLILQGPNGNDVAIDTIQVDADGTIQWEHPTQTNSLLGTYTLILTQGSERHVTYAGLGSEVEVPVRIMFDQSNYLHSDRPKVTIESMPNEMVTFLVTDPTDTIVFRDTIELQSNGRAVYEMSIQNFSTGVYTAIAQKGTAQTSYRFGVGLSMSASEIKIDTIKDRYSPGEQVQILGTVTPNVIIRITLLDPNGDIVQTIDTFSDRTGLVSERQVRIPLNAINGDWTIKMSSGQTSDIISVIVDDAQQNNLSVNIRTVGQDTSIVVSGASGSQVTVRILAGDTLIEGPSRPYITTDGTGILPWTIKTSGIYTIIVEDGTNTAQTTYDFERN